MAKVKQLELWEQELDMYLSNPVLVKQVKGLSDKEYENLVEDLENKISASKLGKSKRRKGSTYENAMAKVFKERLGVELVRTPMSGGFAKNSDKAEEFRGDIVPLDKDLDFKLHIECKNHKSWALPSWIRQAEGDCPKGKIPLVLFHRRQENKDGKRVQKNGDYVCLSLDDFLDIISSSKVVGHREKHTKSRRLKRK